MSKKLFAAATAAALALTALVAFFYLVKHIRSSI